MIKFEYLWNRIFGDTDKISSDRYFVSITALSASIFSLILLIFHLLTGLSNAPALLAAISSVLLFGLYYCARFCNYPLISKTILTIVGLLILDLLWYVKFLSHGPILLFILIFVALIMWLWEGKQLALILVFYFLNFLVLFYIDYNAPNYLLDYPNLKTRSIDIYLSFFFYASLLIFLIYVFKQEFFKQKRKAIHSDKLKSAFLANMSHEIRTPMNGILGFSDLLKNPNLTGEMQKQYIEIIEKSGHRMLNVINDIIDISKIEAGLVTLELKESNVNEQLEYMYKFFKPEAEAKGMKLVYENLLNGENIIITTDREKVFSILTNLIKNAIKYSKEGTIAFGYSIKGNAVEFYVKDTGIGIAKDRQQAIFERFIQADIEDVQARQGSGLGLSITKSYIELLGGEIWLKSEVGKGSQFNFTLPYNPIFKEKEIKEKEILFDGTALNSLGLKILIVEDDEVSRELLTLNIFDICKSPLMATTGLEAVSICRTQTDIDLILMDTQLPELSGYEATYEIRQFNQDVIIIAQTAYGLSGEREKAMEAGCNDYISKPINKSALEALVRKYFT